VTVNGFDMSNPCNAHISATFADMSLIVFNCSCSNEAETGCAPPYIDTTFPSMLNKAVLSLSVNPPEPEPADSTSTVLTITEVLRLIAMLLGTLVTTSASTFIDPPST